MSFGPVTGGRFLSLSFCSLEDRSERLNGGHLQSHGSGHIFGLCRWWKSKLTPFYNNLLTFTLMMHTSREVWNAFGCLIIGCRLLSV
jgi:hypothetical protein